MSCRSFSGVAGSGDAVATDGDVGVGIGLPLPSTKPAFSVTTS
jgi:hypothetical protein